MTRGIHDKTLTTFEIIEQEVQQLFESQEFWAQGTRLQHLDALYRAVRPILMVVASLPLLAQQWREVVNAFIIALDVILGSGGSNTAPANVG